MNKTEKYLVMTILSIETTFIYIYKHALKAVIFNYY